MEMELEMSLEEEAEEKTEAITSNDSDTVKMSELRRQPVSHEFEF